MTWAIALAELILGVVVYVVSAAFFLGAFKNQQTANKEMMEQTAQAIRDIIDLDREDRRTWQERHLEESDRRDKILEQLKDSISILNAQMLTHERRLELENTRLSRKIDSQTK